MKQQARLQDCENSTTITERNISKVWADLGRHRARGGDPEARDPESHRCGRGRSCALRAWLTRSRIAEQTTSVTGVATGEEVATGGAQLRERERTGAADGWKSRNGERERRAADILG